MIESGKPTEPSGKVHFWFETRPDGRYAALVAKHDRDVADQRIIEIELIDGILVMRQQALASFNLCQAFGIKQKETPRIWREKAWAKFIINRIGRRRD
jgi:hypothetical protein